MKRLIWWCVTLVFGIAALIGALLVAYSSVLLFFLLAGRAYPDFESPGVRGASIMLVAGAVHLVFGIMVPKWLDLDQLL